jgi:hypothetical protein
MPDRRRRSRRQPPGTPAGHGGELAEDHRRDSPTDLNDLDLPLVDSMATTDDDLARL